MSEFREESQRERYGTLTHRESGKQQSMIAENASGEKWRSGHCCSTFRLSSSALLDGMAFYFSCHYFFAVHRYSKEYLFPKFVWNVFRVSFLTIRNDATEVSEQIQMPPITRWQTCRTPYQMKQNIRKIRTRRSRVNLKTKSTIQFLNPFARLHFLWANNWPTAEVHWSSMYQFYYRRLHRVMVRHQTTIMTNQNAVLSARLNDRF